MPGSSIWLRRRQQQRLGTVFAYSAKLRLAGRARGDGSGARGTRCPAPVSGCAVGSSSAWAQYLHTVPSFDRLAAPWVTAAELKAKMPGSSIWLRRRQQQRLGTAFAYSAKLRLAGRAVGDGSAVGVGSGAEGTQRLGTDIAYSAKL